MKETAVFDKPFVKKSALLREQDNLRSFYDELKFFRRKLLRFKTLLESDYTWLVD